ncbi:ninja-family protein AFP3-like [Malania oleifera]|uniref:ninja-family protein AFP3-like n=1 Tax=Malania oleifera TaxID=397392 RepID=UPI0025AE8684|nr:ninja-family protein AFP3-like [Malania oleifera]
MGEANEVGNREVERFGDFQRDLLQRFIPGSNIPRKFEEGTGNEAEEIELSLGLSMNGRFGVDPKANKLARSSSVSDFFLNQARNGDTARPIPLTCSALVRTCSLPTETDEEWRKRKELQSLRRMEAKRKRTEKQRNLRPPKDRAAFEDNWPKLGASTPPTSCGVELKVEKTNDLGGGSGGGLRAASPTSHGSAGSQGSGSSGVSDSDSQTIQGMDKNTEAKSPTTIQSLPEQTKQKLAVTAAEKSGRCGGVSTDNPSKNLTVAEEGLKETARNVMRDMPCVSAKGDGPNGKRIEGFLYRYRKGEDVRIVCVCHGSFLSPAEFVKHAGGGDVAHPLRHIVVNTSSFL